MSERRSPAQIKPVLEALSRTEGVIIGGQAINLWAERYQKECFPWTELRPYTSFDLDVLGSRADVLRCSEALDADPYLPGPAENTANSGKVVVRIGGADFEIDFLHTPTGLSPAEVRELAREVQFENIPLKVLHPLHCLESKTVNLATLPQTAGERQDLKHLRLSIAIVREYFIDLTRSGKSDATLLRWARRLRMDSNHEFGLEATIKHGINFQDAVPAELWRSRAGELGAFMQEEWQKWTEEIAEKTSDLREIDAWIRTLNQRPNASGSDSPDPD
jgi:hypothetical protein